jgi:hypothetical protein
MDCWIDELDRTAYHWVIVREGRLVAASRMSVHDRLEDVPEAESYLGVFRPPPEAPIASINRLVVDPGAQRQGLARRLNLAKLAKADQLGCRTAVVGTLNPRLVRQFVELGYAVVGAGNPYQGDWFLQGKVPVVLVCRLPRGTVGRAPLDTGSGENRRSAPGGRPP